jgi:hypothetical protein
LRSLTTPNLAQACRIFMDLAYPAGVVPANKRCYYDMDVERPLADFLPPAKQTLGICQELAHRGGPVHGYEFRLGSTIHPHLKLRVQRLDHHEREVWVYSVDTHDGFLQAANYHNAADAEAWKSMVDRNRLLKHEIEEALGSADFMTPNNLLQLDLPTPTTPL